MDEYKIWNNKKNCSGKNRFRMSNVGSSKQMAGTRVLLEFDDGKKYWNFIDADHLATVQDVIDDIELKFSIHCRKLLLENALLHPKESIKIFRDKDLIRYVLQMHIFLLFKISIPFISNFSVIKKRKLSDVSTEEFTESLNENRTNIFPLSCTDQEVINKPKKKKTEKKVENPQPLIECPLEISATGRDNMVEDITQQVNWILGNEGDICMHPKEKKKETVLDHVSMIESCENGVESCEVLPEEKKKRKRRRKKSQHQTTLEAIDSGSKQDIPLNYEYLTPPFAERKHIHFDNQQDINATEEINQTQNSQVKQYDEQNHFSNSLKSLSNDRNSSKSENIVNDFKATSKPLSNISLPTNFASYLPSPCVNKKSMLTDSITNVPSQFGALLALKTRPTVFSRQPSEKTKVPENQFHYQYPTDTPPESVPVEEESSVSEFNPNTYPLCVGPPRKGDIVAYKV